MSARASTGSRPLRFLAMVAVLWVGGRVAWLWPQTGSLSEAIHRTVPLPLIADRFASLPRAAAGGTTAPELHVSVAPLPAPRHAPVATAPLIPLDTAMHPERVQFALMALIAMGGAAADPQAMPPPFVTSRPRDAAAAPLPGKLRLQGSAWAMARPGTGFPASPQLGGSQVGANVRLSLRGGDLAAVGGVAAPVSSRGAEARIGAEWRPSRHVPVRIVADQRVALDDRGWSGPEVTVIGGIGPMPVGRGYSIEAYGQTGAVARAEIEPYADAALRVTRQAARIGHSRLGIGAGAWAGAQRGAQRIDFGPTLVADLPVGDRHLRLSLDWRQRVGGDAAPGSGPALTLGTNF